MVKKCRHANLKCVDSRPKDGWRYRRYKCLSCGVRMTTVEVLVGEELGPGQRTELFRAELVKQLSNEQARSLLEQIAAGHRTLNLI